MNSTPKGKTSKMCIEWELLNRKQNPYTYRKIIKNGPTYKKLEKKCEPTFDFLFGKNKKNKKNKPQTEDVFLSAFSQINAQTQLTCIPPNFCGECRDVTVAAALGHLDCLQYAHKNGCKWDELVCARAAEYGQLECLKYAHANGCPWNKWTCANAAQYGHLECLEYAHENGCPWDEDTCKWAAYNGQLECLVYAHENGCPWDKDTCTNAAGYGHLDCLEYAHSNGCPWDEETYTNAVINGYPECLVYLHENGFPCIHNISKLEIYSTELDATTDNEDIQCGICYENSNKVEFKPCNHKLCIACFNTLITRDIEMKCPFCRGKVKENLLIVN